jgi:AGZA family xanthine/uracil permease-like MFS transporter
MTADHRREALAGVTTFLAMSYIAVVNPAILSTGTGLGFAPLMTATVLTAAVSSILMGAVARLPFALAPGMGINAFFTYSMVHDAGMTGRQALGATVLAGALFVALSVTPARVAIARAIPASIRQAAAAGIGLFLTFIGLKNGGVVASHPATFVTAAPLGWDVALFAGGLVMTGALLVRGVRGALLLGMLAVTGAALALGRIGAPAELVATPDFSLIGAFDLGGLWQPAIMAAVATILFTDLFDSLSTFLGVAHAAGLTDERGEPLRLGRALTVDAVATLFSGLVGTSSATTYVESAAGIREGGRTGLTAIVCGLCFVPLLFLAPLAELVPGYATAPALVVVGMFMLAHVRELRFDDLTTGLPAFLTMVLMPLTFSITEGLVWGILAHLVLAVVAGRARQVPRTLWVVGLCCVGVLVA